MILIEDQTNDPVRTKELCQSATNSPRRGREELEHGSISFHAHVISDYKSRNTKNKNDKPSSSHFQ